MMRLADLIRPSALAVMLMTASAAACGTVGEERSRAVAADAAEASRQVHATAERPPATTTHVANSTERPAGTDPDADYAVRDALERIGPDAALLHEHVVTLTNPFFEGRSADTRGGEIAAEYIEFHFGRMGLEPAFTAADGEPTFRQPFTVPGGLTVQETSAAYAGDAGDVELEERVDFSPLGFSADGAFTGEIAFVGYSIEDGEDGYTSYHEEDDLTGKAAMMLRFEPMNEEGRSLWRQGRNWSVHASLASKADAAVERGAEAIILVNPPGADDPRVGRMETPQSTRFPNVGVPVIMISEEAADRLVGVADARGRSLDALRQLADDGFVGAIPLTAGGTTIDMVVGVEMRRLPTDNVAAVVRGKGRLADQYVVIGAHYDHLGYGHFGSRSPGRAGEVHIGADDNASGTAGVLLLADRYAQRYAALPEEAEARSVIFLCFAAEERGLLGASHFMDNAPVAPTQIVAMLNMDMIGRLTNERLEIAGTGTAEEWEDIIRGALGERSRGEMIADPLATGSRIDVDAQYGKSPGRRSDHALFYAESIPVLHFFTGVHADYHTPEDSSDRINYAGAAQVANLVDAVAWACATRPAPLTAVQLRAGADEGGPRLAQMKVRLGIAPSYTDDEPGIGITSVSDGTTAAEAGLKAGDRIVRWGGEELADIRGLMTMLASHEPGDMVRIVIVRAGEEMPVTLTMKARDQTDQ